MKKLKTPEQRITIKIGLIFLVVILFLVGLLIYSTSLKKSIDDQKREMDNSYAILLYSNELIFSIQHAQDLLNSYLVSPQRIYQNQYDSISEDIYEQINNIKVITPEKDQEIILENIDSLLQEKNLIVKRLIGQFRSESPLTELDRKIENIEPIIKDSLVVTKNSDTVIINKQKRDFWSRLSHLLDPKYEPDTTISVIRTEEQILETARADTLTFQDLRRISEDASKTYNSQIQRIEREVRELVLAEQNISLHISKLITQFYNEAIHSSRVLNEDSETLTQKIFSFALTVGAISIFLILIIILFIAGDLRKGKKARVDLAKEKQITEDLIDSRHKLLLSVSHDIKTPLSSIMGYMEILESKEKDVTSKKQIKSALNSGQHILSMLSNLLEFSRLEQKTAVLQKSNFNLIDLLEETLSMFRPFTDDKNIDLIFINNLSSPFYVKTDYTVLKQILTNIISNAVKYTLDGKIAIELKQDETKRLLFNITDSGVGIKNEDLDKIFKPFSRTSNSSNAEGSGLGLYVTKGLIEALQGDVSITSEFGKGTAVCILLPIAQITEFLPADRIIEEDSSISSDQSNKILIFEDDASLGALLKEFLQQKGFKAKLCNNSRDINGYIRHISNFDIVLTDLQLVDISGTEILTYIREVDKSIPVWLMTANDEYSQEKAIREGFKGFIPKPIQMRTLIHVLKSSIKVEEKKHYSYNDKIKNRKDAVLSLKDKFPQLAAMFGNDTVSIKKILSDFVETSERDTEVLSKLIKDGNFIEAQRICHKIHPFLNQLDVDYLTTNLRKMDNINGNDGASFPDWKKELTKTIYDIRNFTKNIKDEYI